MDWINIHRSTLGASEFLGCEPTQRATWLCLMAYCADQENGGVIEDASDWVDRKWQQVVRITKDEAHDVCPLWTWSDGSLTVWSYPSDKEEEVRRNRENGGKGGRPQKPRNNQVVTSGLPSGLTGTITQMEPSGYERVTERVTERVLSVENHGEQPVFSEIHQNKPARNHLVISGLTETETGMETGTITQTEPSAPFSAETERKGKERKEKGKETPQAPQGDEDFPDPEIRELNDRRREREEDANDHLDLIPQVMAFQGFAPVWQRWCRANRERRTPITRSVAEAQLEMLSNHPPEVAKAMIVTSIEKNWKSLIPPASKETPAKTAREMPEWMFEKLKKAKDALFALEKAQKRINPATHPSSWKDGLKAIERAKGDVAGLEK